MVLYVALSDCKQDSPSIALRSPRTQGVTCTSTFGAFSRALDSWVKAVGIEVPFLWFLSVHGVLFLLDVLIPTHFLIEDPVLSCVVYVFG